MCWQSSWPVPGLAVALVRVSPRLDDQVQDHGEDNRQHDRDDDRGQASDAGDSHAYALREVVTVPRLRGRGTVNFMCATDH